MFDNFVHADGETPPRLKPSPRSLPGLRGQELCSLAWAVGKAASRVTDADREAFRDLVRRPGMLSLCGRS